MSQPRDELIIQVEGPKCYNNACEATELLSN